MKLTSLRSAGHDETDAGRRGRLAKAAQHRSVQRPARWRLSVGRTGAALLAMVGGGLLTGVVMAGGPASAATIAKPNPGGEQPWVTGAGAGGSSAPRAVSPQLSGPGRNNVFAGNSQGYTVGGFP